MRLPLRSWSLVVLGCGTVGFWVVRSLLELPALWGRLARLVLCDKSRIAERHAITCPLYAGRVGTYKCKRLAELAVPSVGRDRVITIPRPVEQADWTSCLVPGQKTIVVMGLDDWGARLVAANDLRLSAVGSTTGDSLLVQGSVHKDEVQIAVFGAAFDDPCPACGLRALPEPQPCTAEGAGGLLHGNLHREAAAVAGFIRDLMVDEIDHRRTWLNTKTNIYLCGQPTLTRSCRKRQGCLGSHYGTAGPRWDRVLAPLTLLAGGYDE